MGLRCSLLLSGGTVGGMLQSPSVREVDPTAKHFYRSLVLEVAEGTGYGHPVRPNHGPEALVGVVGGYLNLLICGHHPFALAEQQEQASQASGHLLEGEIFQPVLVQA